MKLKNYRSKAGYPKHHRSQLEQAIMLEGEALFATSPFAKTVSYQEKLASFRLRRELGVEGLLIFKATSFEVVPVQSSRVIPTWDVGCEDRVALALDLDEGRVSDANVLNCSPARLESAEGVRDIDSSLVENHTWSNKDHVGQNNEQESTGKACQGGFQARTGSSKSNWDCNRGQEVNPAQSRSDDVFLTHHTILAVTTKAKG